jgi:NAD(P)-dependent dehydrogenase (short-subunit alcohol dehydrogenase family)
VLRQEESDVRLENRVAMVTAAGSGMGRAGARRFAQEGAHVVVSDLDESAAKETVALIEADGGSAEAHQLNVTDLEQVSSILEGIERTHGVLHVLYNHAGIPGAAGLDMSPEQWDLAVDVNLKGAFYVASKATDLLRRAEGKGSIIFTASVSGLIGSPFSPLYSMTKGGIVLLMKSMALNLAPDIRCNAICPGPVDTPMLPQFFGRDPGANVADLMAGFMSAVPLGRPAQPEEIANAALFLACDESSFVTGVALPVDGGYVAR